VTDHVVKVFLDHIESEDLIRKQGQAADPQKENPLKFATPLHMSKVLTWRLQERGTNWSDSAVVWSIGKQTTLRFDNCERLSIDKLFLAENLPPFGWEVPCDGGIWDNAALNRNTDSRLLAFLVPPLDQIKK
jgi:hypothetical protein